MPQDSDEAIAVEIDETKAELRDSIERARALVSKARRLIGRRRTERAEPPNPVS